MLVQEHDCDFLGIFWWIDTRTVLQWIKNCDMKQLVFSTIRVAKVLDSTKVDQWNHINGSKNQADQGTLGISQRDFMEDDWLRGPY